MRFFSVITYVTVFLEKMFGTRLTRKRCLRPRHYAKVVTQSVARDTLPWVSYASRSIIRTGTQIMRTVVGIIIADHLPGVKTHLLNAHVLALSRIAKPADLIIVILLTRPVFKSISSRYKPPRRFRASLAGSLDNARKGYRGAHA